MSKKPPSKDEALEAMDFIVNVLKEHEKDLDRLISELGTVASKLGETGEINVKVGKIEDKISNLQAEVGNLLQQVAETVQTSSTTHAATELTTTRIDQTEPAAPSPEAAVTLNAAPIVVRCKQWEDFQALAAQAERVSFSVRESEGTYEVNALKDRQVIAYSGKMPEMGALLKVWLVKQLGTSEAKVLEGMLSVT
ncbi:MAG: hypothetical protein ACE14S_01860 [Candidatus Bathyarchaeia archaeon]